MDTGSTGGRYPPLALDQGHAHFRPRNIWNVPDLLGIPEVGFKNIQNIWSILELWGDQEAQGLLLVRTRPQRTPPPPLQTPKWLYRTMRLVGARGASDFVLGIRQGEFFLFDPMCLNSKYSEFCGEFKNG